MTEKLNYYKDDKAGLNMIIFKNLAMGMVLPLNTFNEN